MYGISVDQPFSQNVYIDTHDLTILLLNDPNREMIHDYGVVLKETYGIRS